MSASCAYDSTGQEQPTRTNIRAIKTSFVHQEARTTTLRVITAKQQHQPRSLAEPSAPLIYEPIVAVEPDIVTTSPTSPASVLSGYHTSSSSTTKRVSTVGALKCYSVVQAWNMINQVSDSKPIKLV